MKVIYPFCIDLIGHSLNLLSFMLNNGDMRLREFVPKLKLIQQGIEAHISECNICKFEEYNAEEHAALGQQSIGTTKRH